MKFFNPSNLFSTAPSFASIVSIANSTSLSFLGLLSNVFACGSVRPISAQNSSTFDLPSAFANMSAGFDSVATFTARVLLLHALVATTFSFVCDECPCPLLSSKRLPSRSKSLYAVNVAISGSSQQTQAFADPILNILLS